MVFGTTACCTDLRRRHSDSDTNVVGQDMAAAGQGTADRRGRRTGGQELCGAEDNPFVEMKGRRPEIWAYGLRTRGGSPATRRPATSGSARTQDLWEQAYLVKRGDNYGWSVMEGSHPFYLHRKPGPTRSSSLSWSTTTPKPAP